MKLYLIAAMLGLSACVPTDTALVNPIGAVNLMKGAGSVNTTPSGQTSYRWVVPANAYSGIISDPATLRQQHETLIGNFLGERNACRSGFSVDGPQQSNGMLIYTGACR